MTSFFYRLRFNHYDLEMELSDKHLISEAESIAAGLPSLNREIEIAGNIPSEVVSQLRKAGIFHALVPREYGGAEVHPLSMIEIIKRISKADGAVGWNVMIGCTTGLIAASLSEPDARAIYGSQHGPLTVGVTAPSGVAKSVAGGYLVDGRWGWGSGAFHADWVCGGCVVHDENDEKRLSSTGSPEVWLMIFSKDQLKIENTWQVSGMKGTGSNHFSVQNAFVPDGRQVLLGMPPRNPAPLYKFSTLGLLALGVCSVSLGIGYRALEAFKELAATKIPTGSSSTLRGKYHAKMALAKATADIESADAYVRKTVETCFAAAETDKKLTSAERNRLRLAAANATLKSAEAIDALYEAGGGSSIYEENVLQRCFRDVHVTTQHIMVAKPIFEMAGKAIMTDL